MYAAHQRRPLPADGDAGKSADPAQAAPAQDASFQPELPLVWLASAPQDAVAELYKPDAAQSAEQSCAAQGLAARQRPEERLDATYSEPQAQRQR